MASISVSVYLSRQPPVTAPVVSPLPETKAQNKVKTTSSQHQHQPPASSQTFPATNWRPTYHRTLHGNLSWKGVSTLNHQLCTALISIHHSLTITSFISSVLVVYLISNHFTANSNLTIMHCNICPTLHSPRATLALVASWLIQKETQDSITIKIDGR